MPTVSRPPVPLSPDALAFVEQMTSILLNSGMPRMPSRVYSALLATDSGRMTSSELAATLQVSPAAISGAVRWLTQVDMVRRGRDPGSRQDHFIVDNEALFGLIAHDLRSLRAWQTGFQDGLDAVGADSPAGARIAEMVEFFEFLNQELPAMMDRWRERQRRKHK